MENSTASCPSQRRRTKPKPAWPPNPSSAASSHRLIYLPGRNAGVPWGRRMTTVPTNTGSRICRRVSRNCNPCLTLCPPPRCRMASNLPALTLTWPQLDALSPCSEAVVWGHAAYNDQPQPTVAVLRRLIHEHHEDWANWLIVRCMRRPQFITYAIFAAEQVIDLYERQCPGDARPRQAIAAARACLNAPGDQTAGAAEAATWAAGAAEAA